MTEYPSVRRFGVIVDCYGAYTVPWDDVLATAPRRADGWWDQRTTAGRQAAAKFRKNQADREDGP
jgi:hypothetical protein